MGMFIGTPSSIVTNGLTHCFDAGNTASYPGTGTTWFDVSGNGNDGLILGSNEGNYSTSNGGYFQTSTSGIMRMPWVRDASADLTLSWWYMHLTDNHYGILFESRNAANSADSRPLLEGNNTQFSYGHASNAFGYDVTKDVWRYVTVSQTHGGDSYIWVNGVQQDTSNSANSGLATSKLNWGSRAGGSGTGGGSYGQSARWAMIQVYNRGITLAEHTQNYNAHKHRFGL